jgi:hypothetical protein
MGNVNRKIRPMPFSVHIESDPRNEKTKLADGSSYLGALDELDATIVTPSLPPSDAALFGGAVGPDVNTRVPTFQDDFRLMVLFSSFDRIFPRVNISRPWSFGNRTSFNHQ